MSSPRPQPQTARRQPGRVRALVVLGLATACLAAGAEELLPYRPPSVRQEMQQSAPVQQRPAAPAAPRALELDAQERNRIANVYLEQARAAHQRGDEQAERYFLARWRELVVPRDR